MKIVKLPKHRRPTYYFLRYFDNRATVHLATQVDMTRVIAHRRSADNENKISYIGYVVWAAARALARCPEANASFHAGFWGPRIACYDRVNAKVTFDKTLDDQRVVFSGVVEDADTRTLAQIQQRIAYLRDTPNEQLAELRPFLTLQKLPIGLGWLAYRSVFDRAQARFQAQGSFTVTSLGHRDILDFYPIPSTATCFALGAVRDTPVAENGAVVVRPVMQIGLAFDHRVLDGAAAADLLTDVKTGLEAFAGTSASG